MAYILPYSSSLFCLGQPPPPKKSDVKSIMSKQLCCFLGASKLGTKITLGCEILFDGLLHFIGHLAGIKRTKAWYIAFEPSQYYYKHKRAEMYTVCKSTTLYLAVALRPSFFLMCSFSTASGLHSTAFAIVY